MTVLTPAQLIAEIAADLPSGNPAVLTAASLRGVLGDMVTSLANPRVQRSFTASPIVLAADDQIINFNIGSGSPTCTLPVASTRAGLDLIFKDAGGNASAHNLTVTFSGGELCDGQPQVVISGNFDEVTFRPYNDGVNTGWSLR